jgi:hypothetical protein
MFGVDPKNPDRISLPHVQRFGDKKHKDLHNLSIATWIPSEAESTPVFIRSR